MYYGPLRLLMHEIEFLHLLVTNSGVPDIPSTNICVHFFFCLKLVSMSVSFSRSLTAILSYSKTATKFIVIVIKGKQTPAHVGH